MIRVVAIDDHPLILQAISQELGKHSDIKLVGTADHGSKLFDLVTDTSPEVVILDLGMATGKFDPMRALRMLSETHPSVRVIILTGDDNSTYMRALIAGGAKGYILKSDSVSLALPEAIRTVQAGEIYYSKTVITILFTQSGQTRPLSEREKDVLRLVVHGSTNSSIAKELVLSENHVRNILSCIYEKVGIQENDGEINPRVVLVKMVHEKGLLLE